MLRNARSASVLLSLPLLLLLALLSVTTTDAKANGKQRLLNAALRVSGLQSNRHKIIGQPMPCGASEHINCKNGGRCLKWPISSTSGSSPADNQPMFAFACECPVPYFGILCQQNPHQSKERVWPMTQALSFVSSSINYIFEWQKNSALFTIHFQELSRCVRGYWGKWKTYVLVRKP